MSDIYFFYPWEQKKIFPRDKVILKLGYDFLDITAFEFVFVWFSFIRL